MAFLTVTPHVGVWIETSNGKPRIQHHKVTPHVGVWIETVMSMLHLTVESSHLM